MRIVAKTANGFLVEMDVTEIANVAGFRWEHSAPWWEKNSRLNGPPIGGVIKVSEVFGRLEDLRKAEEKVVGSIAALRGLADLLERALPTSFVPPAPEPAPPAEPQW